MTIVRKGLIAAVVGLFLTQNSFATSGCPTSPGQPSSWDEVVITRTGLGTDYSGKATFSTWNCVTLPCTISTWEVPIPNVRSLATVQSGTYPSYLGCSFDDLLREYSTTAIQNGANPERGMLALKRRMTLFMEQGCAFYPYIYNALYSNPITQGYSYMPSGIHRASIAFRFSGVNLTVCARLGFTSSSPYHDALVRTESAVNALKSGAASQIRLGQIIEGPQFFKNTRDPLGPTDLVEVRGVFSASEDIAQQFNPARPEIIRPVNLSAPPVYPPFTFPQ